MKNVAFYAVVFSILMVVGMWNYACYGKNAYPVEPDYPPTTVALPDANPE